MDNTDVLCVSVPSLFSYFPMDYLWLTRGQILFQHVSMIYWVIYCPTVHSGGASRERTHGCMWLLALMTCDRSHVTCDKLHVTHDL